MIQIKLIQMGDVYTVSSGRITQMTIFRPKVVKNYLSNFPEPLSVGKLDVDNSTFSNTANTLQARHYLKHIQGRSLIHCLINC